MIVTRIDVHPTVGPIVGPIVEPIVGSSKRPFDYRSDWSVRQFDRINVRPTVGPIVGPIVGPTVGSCKRRIRDYWSSWGLPITMGIVNHPEDCRSWELPPWGIEETCLITCSA